MARIPKLDSAGKFLAADVNAQLDARTKATMRADLPALAEELKIGGSGIEEVSGTVTLDASGAPIREFFTTGATTFKANGADTLISSFTALVWRRTGSGLWGYQVVPDEWATPAPTPDTTAPVAGTLAVTVTDVKADLSVSGASDDRGYVQYGFSKDNGATWTAYQDAAAYTFTGLTASTAYQFRHRVKDAAGNVTTGTAVSEVTAAEAPWGQVWADDFTTWEDGSIFGKQMQSAPSPTVYVPFGRSDASRVEAGKLVDHKSISNVSRIPGMGAQVSLGDGITRVSMTLNLYIGGTHGSGVAFLLWGQSQGVTSGIMTGNTLDHRYGFQLNDPDLTGSGVYTTTELPFTTGHTTRSTVTVYADATINQARNEATVTVTSSTGAVLHDQAKIPVQGGPMFGVYGTVASTTEVTYLNRWEVRAE